VDEEQNPEEQEEQHTCEVCGKRRATVHLTEFVDGQPVLRLLCEECYAEREGVPLVSPTELFAQILSAVAPELKELSMKQCSACGISYLEFRQQGTLGCPQDYEEFGKALTPLLKEVHGATQHCGKVSPEAGEREVILGRLRALRRRQDNAVAREDYELAAKLRDEIAKLEPEADDLDEPEG